MGNPGAAGGSEERRAGCVCVFFHTLNAPHFPLSNSAFAFPVQNFPGQLLRTAQSRALLLVGLTDLRGKPCVDYRRRSEPVLLTDEQAPVLGNMRPPLPFSCRRHRHLAPRPVPVSCVLWLAPVCEEHVTRVISCSSSETTYAAIVGPMRCHAPPHESQGRV